MIKSIKLLGVRQNNLKNIDVEIQMNSFTVICGPSGSGKSSLAFETLYAEGQRRYIESLSNYSKQFLNKAPKPDVEKIENIPPAISIEQKNSVKSSRSTVGTTTEIVDYLRLVFEKAGKVFCPIHALPLDRDSTTSGADKMVRLFDGARGYLLAPVNKDRTLQGKKLMAEMMKDGFARVYLPKKTKPQWTSPEPFTLEDMGTIVELSELKKEPPKDLFYIIIDRAVVKADERDRLADSLSQAYHASLKYNMQLIAGTAIFLTTEGKRLLLSDEHSCSVCGYKFPNITSALFSFNSPVGACQTCNGFGNILTIDESKVVPNPKLPLSKGAITPFAMPSAAADKKALYAFCKKAKIDLNTPWEELPREERALIWNGKDKFWGVKGLFEYLETKKYKMHVRVFLSRYKSPHLCTTCNGTRLKPESNQVVVGERSISQLCDLTVDDLSDFMTALKLDIQSETVCVEPLRQVKSRLQFLKDVGVGYLSLNRPTRTLSGGEFQRLILANQLGMGLSQTLYVLDEPTVGLHPRDNDRLIKILKGLRSLGNTLVVVEHDQDVIKSATHILEMGPGSGHLGGELIYSGPLEKFWTSEKSVTVPYLLNHSKNATRELKSVDIPSHKYVLNIKGCTGHNLKNIDVVIPLHRMVTVTGVSGSGKSTLVTHTLFPALARELEIDYLPTQPYRSLTGQKHLKNVVLVDQSSIGKTARSSPVTYLKIYDAIRTLMASTNEARALALSAGSFSLNIEGGRCPACKGLGYELVDMVFMDDIEIKCETCDGKRFRPEVLGTTFMGKNINEILNMTVLEAMEFFVSYPNIRKPLVLLKEVGLEYIRLGQSASSLSGGESQRLKIARELLETQQKDTLYILDEPTTGLHFREVHLLLSVLNKLIENGGSVILIEHNLEVIRSSDYVIDIGPEGGAHGGEVVAVGSPNEITKAKLSHTGRYLKEYLESGKRAPEKLNHEIRL